MADELNSNTKGGVNAAPKAVEPTFAPADEPREALAPAASGEAPAAPCSARRAKRREFPWATWL